MTRRAELKAENRAKLLSAARKVFAEKGVAAATARDIVRETDLASGTFYNYFDDKDDAFRVVMDEFTTQARAGAREARQRLSVDVDERLYQAYRSYFELVVADPEMFEVLRRNADAIAMLGTDDLFTTAIAELAEDFRMWVDRGDLPAGVVDWLPYVGRAIAGGAFQVAAQLADEDDPDVDRAARFCAQLVLDGLRGVG